MKFGRLVYRYTGCTYVEKGAIYNIGDNMQTFAVDNLYRRMGVAPEDIVDINFADMKYYNGEEVILPMVGYASYYKWFNQLPTSEKIIPFFIGFEMSDATCDDIVPYLRKHEPIGCRDEATMQLLRKKGVEAYVSGCLTITLPRRKEEPVCPKTFFVDISSKLEKFIPDELKKNCEYVKHGGNLNVVPMTEDERVEIDKIAMERLNRYRNEAGLVVTSRLHAAAPCIALGIPVILATDNIDGRFSWLDKLIPIYDADHYSEIDWSPEACECEWIKEKLFDVFKSNILAISSRKSMQTISQYWEDGVKAEYDGRLWRKITGLRNHLFDYSSDYALITSHPSRFEAVKALNKMEMEWEKDYCYFISKDIPYEKWWGIKRKDEIVLYGYNAYCREQADRLINEGYTVISIIDQNPQNKGNYMGIPIKCSIEELVISEKTCVFIMLQNGMLHWDIAFELYKYGINRVVFLPMKIGFYSNNIQIDFIKQYNYMIEGMYSLMWVPCLNDKMFEQLNERKWYVAKQLDSTEYIVWVSKDLVRTSLREPEKYRNIPIAEFMPYISLFLHLSGEENDISEYIRVFGKVPLSMEKREAYRYVINKRQELYNFLEDKFNSGNIDYFTIAAPKAVWNENGYLNLCEGQHRCIYLLLKGMSHVPIRVDDRIIDRLNEAL